MDQAHAKELADRIVEYVLSGARYPDTAVFLKTDVEGLNLIRNPRENDLPLKHLRTVMRFWRKLPQIDGVPNVVKIDPEQLISVLGYLMLVDIGGEADFRYSLYGTKIARVSGFDLTGKCVWEDATTSSTQTFLAACYLAARQLKNPIYLVHKPSHSITVSHWHRLILPLGLGGDIKRFLVCSVPILDGEIR